MESSAGTLQILVGIAAVCFLLAVIVVGFVYIVRGGKNRKVEYHVSDSAITKRISTDPGSGSAEQAPIESKKSPIERFTEEIREKRKSGLVLAYYFDAVLAGFGDAISQDRAIDACISLDFKDSEIATLLDHLGYTLNEVAEKIEEDYSMSAEEWVALLYPFSKATSDIEKGKEVLEAISYAAADIDSDFVKPLVAHGISENEAIKLVYEESKQTLFEILDDIGFQKDPVSLAAVARLCDVDLSDADEYDKLRDEMDFSKALVVLKEFGKSLDEIVSIENSCSTIENGDIGGYLNDLKVAGFGTTEILCALMSECDEVNLGGMVSALQDKAMTEGEFIDFAVADKDDPYDLNTEFDEQDVDLEIKVRVLHNLFVALKQPTAKVVVSQS